MNRADIIRNFFPEDTRLVEFCSAISLMFMALLIYIQAPALMTLQHLVTIQRHEFWGLLAFVFGSTQFITLMFYPKLELLRCVMSMVCGAILIWISLGAIDFDIQLTDTVTFAVGVANLYAFVINSVQIRRIWEN